MTNSKKSAISWIELGLIILLAVSGMGIWVFMEQLVNLRQKSEEPLEATYQKQADVLLRQAELSGVQGELTAIQSKLAEQRMEQIRKRYQIETLEAAQKSQPPLAPLARKGAPDTGTDSELEKTRTDLETTRKFIDALTADLPLKRNASIDSSVALEDAKLKALAEFNKARIKFLWRKRLITLSYTVVTIIVLLLLVWVGISLIGSRQRFRVNRVIVFGTAVALLSILIGYQVFEFVGASLIGVFILVVILAFVPDRQNS